MLKYSKPNVGSVGTMNSFVAHLTTNALIVYRAAAVMRL